MNLIWLLLQASWLQVAIAILAGLVSGGTTARLIALINNVVNGNYGDDLFWQFPLLAAIVIVSGIISQVLLIHLSQNAVYRLRLRLSHGILSSPLRYLEEVGASRLLATLTDDISTLSNTIYAIPFICVDIAVIAGCLFYLLFLSGFVFTFTLGFMMVAIGGIQILINRAQFFLTSVRQEQDQLFQHFRSITDGIKELKLNTSRRQDFLQNELEVSAARYRNQNSAALLTFSISTGLGNLLFFTLIGLILIALPRVVDISPPVLSAYILTLTYLLLPMQSILAKLQELVKGNVALQKIEAMGLELAAKTEATSIIVHHVNSNWQQLELQKVTYSYHSQQEDKSFILGPIDLTFNPGEIVFIVGGNGSGKSSLGKIITGLYTPDSGTIKLSRKVVFDENREWYRQHFAAIFSDFYLFDRISGINSRSMELEAQKYLQQLHLDDKVKIINNQFSTTSLSQGQRKRLALLTAYLEDRPIYFFDEWASDQDPFFRELFYQQILKNLKKRGKTVIVISHDDRYFSVADRVIKLDYGKIEYNHASTNGHQKNLV
jgi:putative pyoverdin transport system ATP-binding/permease protein